jgi:hypothetical protein
VTSRTFHLGDILSITTGRLVSPRHMDGVCDILGWMTGESLFTHQIPRASRECEGPLLARHPDLADVAVPENFGGEAGVNAWLREQVERFGEAREVTPLRAEGRAPIDPLTEMRIAMPNAEIIAVAILGEGETR